MRYRPLLVLAIACLGLLSACTKAVLGPDLAQRPTPFVSEGTVELDDSFGVMRATVTARPAGDTATVRFSELGDKPYNATVTYHAFIPIISERNTARKDYWLVGLNLTQTSDKSFYAILRYPHGQPLQPGTTRDDFEFRVLDCGTYPKPKQGIEATKTEINEGPLRQDVPADLISYQESDTLCIFDQIEEVEKHANQILQHDDSERREALIDPEKEPVTRWSQLKVTAR